MSSSSYETITVSSGSTFEYSLSSGETWSNKLIDITASGAHFRVMTGGDGWTIRDVGVKGANDDTSDTNRCFGTWAPNNGYGLMENVYLGDGGGTRTYHAPVGGYGNAGHVDIRNVYCEDWGADGLYLSQPGAEPNRDRHNGTFTVENCYAKNNNIENIRIGTPGSVIRGCVVHVESRDAVNANESGQRNPRGIWLKEQGGLLVEDCDVFVRGASAILASDEGSGTVRNSQVDGSIDGPISLENVGSNPDLSIPSGIPTTAEQAASGETSDGGGGGGGGGGGSLSATQTHTVTVGGGDGGGGTPSGPITGARVFPRTSSESSATITSNSQTHTITVTDPHAEAGSITAAAASMITSDESTLTGELGFARATPLTSTEAALAVDPGSRSSVTVTTHTPRELTAVIEPGELTSVQSTLLPRSPSRRRSGASNADNQHSTVSRGPNSTRLNNPD